MHIHYSVLGQNYARKSAGVFYFGVLISPIWNYDIFNRIVIVVYQIVMSIIDVVEILCPSCWPIIEVILSGQDLIFLFSLLSLVVRERMSLRDFILQLISLGYYYLEYLLQNN